MFCKTNKYLKKGIYVRKKLDIQMFVRYNQCKQMFALSIGFSKSFFKIRHQVSKAYIIIEIMIERIYWFI